MTIILALETATEACSAALLIHDEIKQQYVVSPQQHANLILPMCKQLLDEAGISFKQIDAIAFGRGPGSFTGVRIAAGVTQGLAFAHELPVLPVSSLQALAQTAYVTYDAKNVLACIDARMGEMYWSAYQCSSELMSPIIKEEVIAPHKIAMAIYGKWFGVGSAWKSYQAQLQTAFSHNLNDFNSQLYPTAQSVLQIALQDWQLGKFILPEQVLPVYLRDKVVM